MIAVAAMAALAAGCASQGTKWYHDTKGEQAFYRDSAQCEAMARGSAGDRQVQDHDNPVLEGYNAGAAANAASAQRRIYRHCMRGEGWRPGG